MQGQKSSLFSPHGGWFRRGLKSLGLFLALVSFSNLVFSENIFALYTPTLSASVDNSVVSVNGNQVINSTSRTSELPVRITVNTNNKTGYTATLNTETNETALVNSSSMSGAKIDSIDTNKLLTNFSQNTWGFLSPSNGNYQPIPGLSNSANLFSTAAKTLGNESFDFKIGMKLSDNLESGNYTNKLVISVISNPYTMRAVMTTGKDFNRKVDSIVTSLSNDDGWGNKESANHIRRSSASINDIPAGAIDVESNETSDYPIKIWYDAASKTVFYWAEANKIFLNKDSRYMFRGFTKTEDIDISNFDSSEVEDMAYFFYKMNSLQSLDLSSFNTDKVTDMTGVFAYANSLKKLDLSNFNTSKVTNMSTMFHSMSNLDELNISSFNTENVTNMSGMFYGVSKLASLELLNFDTSNVTDMSQMFARAESLVNLNLSSFNTSKVTTMYYMFLEVSKLQSLDLFNFDTRNVINMEGMFDYMASLKTLNVTSFNTENVENMNGMFANLLSMEELDLSSFKTPKVKTFRAMFCNLVLKNGLRKIYVSSDFETSAALAYQSTDIYANIDIFYNQKQLVGGNGTTLSNTSLDYINFLKIDRPGAPGLFTRKP